jgi:hypothetical protein
MAYTTEYSVNEETQQGAVLIILDSDRHLAFIVDGTGNEQAVDAEIHAAMFADFADMANVERFAALCVANPSTAMLTYYNTRPV